MANTPTYAEIKELLCDKGIDKLRKQGFDPEGLPPDGYARRTYLLLACLKGDLCIVRSLLDLGASVEATDDYGNTALMLVCISVEEERAELVECLLERSEVRTIIDSATTSGGWSTGRTALHISTSFGNAAVVRVLLRCGVDATKIDINGHTAAALARWEGKEEMAQLINNYTQFVNIGEWRPWNDYERPKPFRKATKTILLLAKM